MIDLIQDLLILYIDKMSYMEFMFDKVYKKLNKKDSYLRKT